MKKIVIVLGLSGLFPAIGFSGSGGCGGGSSTGAAATTHTTEEASSGLGSASAPLSAVETSLLSSVFRSNGTALVLKREASESGSVSVDNCIESTEESSGDGFTVTCDCVDTGETSGTVTTTFTSGRVAEECASDDGRTLSIISLSGSVTVEFEACALETCGSQITLSGRVQGTLDYTFNNCTSDETLEATLETEEACSGLTITREDDTIDIVGFSMTGDIADGESTREGTSCINGETAELSDLEDLCNEESGESCSEATTSCASDFACQLFAESRTDDAFYTDNVACVDGCCIISETGRCSDSEDNDFDGETDCDDSDCSEDPYCTIGPCGSGTVSCADDFTCQVFAENSSDDVFTTSNVSCSNGCCVAADASEAAQCTDGEDNDLDGSADCEDPDCSLDLACAPILPCTTADNCRALAASTGVSEATASCTRYDAEDPLYPWNDGTCRFDCRAASVSSDCLEACANLIRQYIDSGQLTNGGMISYVDQFCLFYPPPH